MDKCFVCAKNAHKYRCPVCKVVRYCSIDCFKLHRASPCGANVGAATASNAAVAHPLSCAVGAVASSATSAQSTRVDAPHFPSNSSAAAPYAADDDHDSKLDTAQLLQLESWPELAPWLSSHAPLRAMVRELDRVRATSGPGVAVQQLQRALDADPHFSSFVHEMLVRVGARDVQTSSLAPLHSTSSSTAAAAASSVSVARSKSTFPSMPAAAAQMRDPLLHSGAAVGGTPASVTIRNALDWDRVSGAPSSILGLPMQLTGDPLDPSYLNRYLELRAQLKGEM